MKIGVVSQLLTPKLRDDNTLLCLRVGYKNDPSTARFIWFQNFEHGLAHCFYSSLTPSKPPLLEEGWEDVEQWSCVLISDDLECQYKTRDELLLHFAALLKQHAADVDLGTLLQQRAFEAAGYKPS